MLPPLLVKVLADTKDYEKDMKQAQKTATSFSKNLQNAGKKMMGAGKMLTMGVTAPIIAGGIAAIKFASDYEEARNKIEVVFAGMSDAVLAWSEDASTSMGLSKTEAIEAAGTYGNLFTTMGMGEKASADLSMQMVQTASDVASFNNAATPDVLNAFRSAIVGEFEPLKNLGINLNVAKVQAKAFELGLIDMTKSGLAETTLASVDASEAMEEYDKALELHGETAKETLEAEINMLEATEKYNKLLEGTPETIDDVAKAQAAWALITEGAANSAGDFAETSDGLANSIKIVKADISDLAVEIGQVLLPVVMPMVETVKEWVGKFKDLTDGHKELIVKVALVAAAIGPLLLAFGAVASAVGTIVGVMSVALLPILAVVAGAAFLIFTAWKQDWGGIQGIVSDAMGNILGDLETELPKQEEAMVTSGRNIEAEQSLHLDTLRFHQRDALVLREEAAESHYIRQQQGFEESNKHVTTLLDEHNSTVLANTRTFQDDLESITLAGQALLEDDWKTAGIHIGDIIKGWQEKLDIDWAIHSEGLVTDTDQSINEIFALWDSANWFGLGDDAGSNIYNGLLGWWDSIMGFFDNITTFVHGVGSGLGGVPLPPSQSFSQNLPTPTTGDGAINNYNYYLDYRGEARGEDDIEEILDRARFIPD